MISVSEQGDESDISQLKTAPRHGTGPNITKLEGPHIRNVVDPESWEFIDNISFHSTNITNISLHSTKFFIF